jgi:GH43 family beta-xylosidase
MLYYNGYYYLTATTWSSDPTVGVTMKRGATIEELKNATPQRIFFDTTSSRCCNIWAPEFHLLNGPNGLRWYLYYVAGVSANTDSQRMYVAESAGTDPLGPYIYKGQLAVGGPTDAWAVDPTIMQINGQLYLFYSAYEGVHYSSSQNIYGVALSNPWTVSGSPALISRPQFSWETQTAAVNEAPVQLTAPNGTIYLVFSATWCGNPNYQLGRATYNGGNVLSQSSWVKHSSPIFSQANGQSSTAHNGFFKSPDGTEDWIVYHGVNNTSGDCGATLRTTRIQKYTWNADNTPNLGQPLGLNTDIPVPSGDGGVIITPTPTNTQPPQQTNPIVHYQFDGNANDSSGNGLNAVLVNGPAFTTGQVGQAVNFDGSNDYVNLPIGGVINSLNDFTIATWVRLDTTASWRRIFDFGSGTSVNMFLTPTSGSTVRFAITTGGGGAEQRINGTSALPTGTWTHVAVTRSGNTGRLYVNGTQVGQNTSMTLSPASLGNTNQNWLGRSQYSSDGYLDGQIDDFRIYNRALSGSEVQSLANNGGPTPTPTLTPTQTATPTITPTQDPSGLWARYSFEGNANDSSGNARNGTLVNGPTFVTGRVGQAVNLDGSNDYVNLPTGIISTLSNFTVASWVKLDTTGSWRRIFDFGTGTSVNMFLVPQSSSSTVRFAITTSGNGAEQQLNATPVLPTGTWKHVTVTKSGNTATLYVDGVQVAQSTNMILGPSSLGNTNQNWIGRSQYSGDAYLDAQIDEFRIYNRALSTAEILVLFQNP